MYQTTCAQATINAQKVTMIQCSVASEKAIINYNNDSLVTILGQINVYTLHVCQECAEWSNLIPQIPIGRHLTIIDPNYTHGPINLATLSSG